MATSSDSAERGDRSDSPVRWRLAGDAFSRRLLLATTVLIVAAWSLLGVDVWRMNRERIEQISEQAASVAHAVDQRVTRALNIADQVLRLVRQEIRNRRAWSDPDSLHDLLEQSTPHLDEILTVAFVGPDGVSLAHANPAVASGKDYSGSDFFRFFATERSDVLYVERPLIGPASGQRIFTLSRALRDGDGKLLGIVNATMRTDLLADEFAAIRIGRNGSLGFHHLPTYSVIARQPDYFGTFGLDLMHNGLRDALKQSPQGIFEGAISADNVQRFFAYRKLTDLPLAVTVGVARSDITDKLHEELLGYLTLMSLLTLAIACGSVAILRAHHRELALRRNLADKDALIRGFFDATPAGMCTLDTDMRYLLVNPAMAKINGKPLDAYAGRTVGEVHPTLLERLTPIHREVFVGRRSFHDVAFSGRTSASPGTTGHWQATFFPILDTERRVAAMGCFVIEVTAQKQAEDALRSSQTLLAGVLDLLPVGVWITDADGRIVRSNPAAEKIWSGTRSDGPIRPIHYKGWWAEGGQPLGQSDWAVTRALQLGETVVGQMIEIECLDGSRKTVLNSALPLRSDDGRLTGAVAVNEDISAIRRAQDEMRIARDFFEQTFEAAPVGMAITNIDGCYIQVNRAMTEFIGYSAEELQGMSYIDITHPDDVEANQKTRKQLLAGDFGSHLQEKRYVRKDGSTVWALLVVSLVRDAGGSPLYTIGQTLDITRQKLAEQALRASAIRFRAIFENASTGIVSADDDGSVSYFNEAFRLMLGHDPEALRQLHLADFTDPDDFEHEQRLLDEIRNNLREHYRLEKRYRRADGGILWVDSSVSAIRANGRVQSFITVAYDVSERKQAELALSNSRQKLRALAAHQTRLLEEDRKHIAREIHDELGQLLTALKMDISLLRMGSGDDPALQSRIGRMREVVDQTMDVVRHVATNLRPSVLDLGLLPAIEWLADDFSARWEIPCTLDTGNGDGRELALNDVMSTAVFRVIQESLTNVVRHAAASRVAITLRRDPGLLRVAVRDDGRGFNMAETSRKKGFGLFGMRERVLAVGGKVSIDGRPGEGTTVTITLPILEEIVQ